MRSITPISPSAASVPVRAAQIDEPEEGERDEGPEAGETGRVCMNGNFKEKRE